jgi:hypothetical protein
MFSTSFRVKWYTKYRAIVISIIDFILNLCVILALIYLGWELNDMCHFSDLISFPSFPY